jgi:Uncharacterized conserved protein
MAKINSFTYGSIVIDNVEYGHDVYILPSGKVEERPYGHTFTKDQINYISKEKPDAVFVGKGTSGLASLSDDARSLLEKEGIEIIEDDTPNIKDRFNDLSKIKRVAAIIHITC